MRTLKTERLLTRKGVSDQPEARRRMIAGLARRGFDPVVLRAMDAIPRHAFAEAKLERQAYVDCFLFTGDTVLTMPSYVAFMTQQLHLNCCKVVLEIGTGTGYQTAILALLAGGVFTIERVPSLVKESAENLATLGFCNIAQKLGDGYQGWPEAAPFDAILVAATAPAVPQILVSQLHPERGRMVIPIGTRSGPQRLRLVCREKGRIRTADLGPTCFVPLVPASAPSFRSAEFGTERSCHSPLGPARGRIACGTPHRCA